MTSLIAVGGSGRQAVVLLTSEQQSEVSEATGLVLQRLQGDGLRFTAMALAADALRSGATLSFSCPQVLTLTNDQRRQLEESLGIAADALAFDIDALAVTYAEEWSVGDTSVLGKTVRIVSHDSPGEFGESPTLRLLTADAAQGVFGTGRHAATRLMADLLVEHLHPGDEVADIGTGSGVLALMAAQLGARSVLALDTSAEAVAVARMNAELTQVQNVVTIKHRGLEAHDGPFDLIAANLFPRVLLAEAAGLAGALREGGLLLISGMVNAREDQIRQAFELHALAVTCSRRQEGWSALALRRVGDEGRS